MEQAGYLDTSWPWKGIWRTKAPIKTVCFGWIETWRTFLTQDNLQKKSFALGNRCYLCEEELETVNHLLMHCRIARQCWEFFFSIVRSLGSCLRV